jgi:hypothetical protein
MTGAEPQSPDGSEAMIFNAKKLLRNYEYGLGFKKGDVLIPRSGVLAPFGVIENKVVVLDQSLLIPHQYKVVGEHPNPRSPADRFVTFTINGHEWDYDKT